MKINKGGITVHGAVFKSPKNNQEPILYHTGSKFLPSIKLDAG
jgi:hypothetical protein